MGIGCLLEFSLERTIQIGIPLDVGVGFNVHIIGYSPQI